MDMENVGGNLNTNLNLAYDEYAKNDEVKIVEIRTDYAVLMRETLAQLQDGIDNLDMLVLPVPNLKNLVKVAQDYLFYLEDNRRTII
jgi:uncharacterized pyridoxamine 5'-phosphate oxidase family protein